MKRLSARLDRFAAAFAAAAGFPKDPAAPISAPGADFSAERGIQIMRCARPQKKEPSGHVVHLPTLSERKTELSIIRWCYAVADIRADSPRFAYYVSRWDVPAKVAALLPPAPLTKSPPIAANRPGMDAIRTGRP